MLTVTTYHLLSNPSILQKLKAELKTVIRPPYTDLPPGSLEKLPYLTAVIKEGLRLAYGVTSRIPRVAPDTALQFQEWTIPPNTPVSMTIPLTHHNETIFPDSHSFKPERWIEDSTGHLDKYPVSFSKGSRICLGINLAWSEMYICIAALFSRFGTPENRELADLGILELFKTDAEDVRLRKDKFFPVVKEGSKGVRVKVRSI